MFNRSGWLGVALACLLPPPTSGVAAAGATLHVDRAAIGAADGRSWADAYTTLQDGLAAARSGDRIWVAAGTYHPDQGGEQTVGSATSTFHLRNGVAIYGGFPPGGGDGSFTARDWQSNPTILSGDIDGNDLATAGGWVANAADIVGNNVYSVVSAAGSDASAVLDGFMITAGSATGAVDVACTRRCGGGLNNRGGSPTLVNLQIVGNRAGLEGGGMFSSFGSPTFERVTFTGNQALVGGGLHVEGSGSPVLTAVRFSGNGADIEGGGMSISFSAPTLVNAEFSGNSAGAFGGGLMNNGGRPVLVNVTASGNRALGAGGAMYHRGLRLVLQNSLVWNNLDGSGRGTARASIHDPGGGPVMRHSLIQGVAEPDHGNLDGTDPGHDPGFMEMPDPVSAPTTAGNLRLQPGSSAIDRGSNALLPVGVTLDLDGNPRIVGEAVDLGAYEAPRP